jgi:hypothetical protein
MTTLPRETAHSLAGDFASTNRYGRLLMHDRSDAGYVLGSYVRQVLRSYHLLLFAGSGLALLYAEALGGWRLWVAVPLLVLGGPRVVLDVLRLPFLLLSSGSSVFLYERGIVYVSRRRHVRTFRWRDVRVMESTRRKIDLRTGSEVTHGTNHVIFGPTPGRLGIMVSEVTYRRGAALTSTIESLVSQAQYGPAIEDLLSGHSLRFGKLVIDTRGLYLGKDFVPWTDRPTAVHLPLGFVYVRGAEKTRRLTFPESRVPNVHMVLELIEALG